MKDYGIIEGSVEPRPIEITSTSVFVASNVQPYEEEIGDHVVSGYRYNYKEYTKDEYLLEQAASITSLQEELTAAKVLLGVE